MPLPISKHNDEHIPTLAEQMHADYCNPDPPETEHFVTNTEGDWMPVLCIIGELEEFFNTKYNIPAAATDRTPGVYFHLWMIGVSPAGRGKGIAKGLTRHSLNWARDRGFKMAFAECTGAISTHILTKHSGAIVEKFIDYSTWNGCDTASIIRGLPKAGHKGMSLTVNHFTD